MERIGIFCADESELAPFLRRLEREEVRQAVMLPFTLGRLEGCPVALVAGGVGKVNAAIAAQQLISLCGAKAVIDAGAAGGGCGIPWRHLTRWWQNRWPITM